MKVAWHEVPQREATVDPDGYTVWATRRGTVRLADGTEHRALLEFCETDSNEHYGTAIFVGSDPDAIDPEKDFVWHDAGDFLDRLGRAVSEVYPYRYRYEGPPVDDHHVGADGWSR